MDNLLVQEDVPELDDPRAPELLQTFRIVPRAVANISPHPPSWPTEREQLKRDLSSWRLLAVALRSLISLRAVTSSPMALPSCAMITNRGIREGMRGIGQDGARLSSQGLHRFLHADGLDGDNLTRLRRSAGLGSQSAERKGSARRRGERGDAAKLGSREGNAPGEEHRGRGA